MDFAAAAKLATARLKDENAEEADRAYKLESAYARERSALDRGWRDAHSALSHRLVALLIERLEQQIAEHYAGHVAKLAPVFMQQIEKAETISMEVPEHGGVRVMLALPAINVCADLNGAEMRAFSTRGGFVEPPTGRLQVMRSHEASAPSVEGHRRP